MDQSKTNLPHFTGRRSKGVDAANLLSTHIQGVLNHGLNRFTTFVDINEYSHDPNLVMNTLLREIYDTSVLMESHLPPVLYLQADNCFRENKNRYMMGFCELLVRKNIFKEVHLSFLMVGHTHEDIDAAFSKIADKLRRQDAETLVQLMDVLPDAKQTSGIYNIKEWLEPNITPMTGQTGPLHYKFSRNERDECVVEYKGLNNRPWKKLTKPVLKQMPSGIPKLVLPNFKKIKLDCLKKNIEKCKYLFSDIVSHTQYRWWQRFMEYIDGASTNQIKASFYAKKNARWLLPLLPKQAAVQPSTEFALPPDVQEMVDKEADDPIVIMKSPKRKKKETRKEPPKKTQSKRKDNSSSRVVRRFTTSYIYLDMSQKRQRYFYLVFFLIELLCFLNFLLYVISCTSLLYLIRLYNIAISIHISMLVQSIFPDDILYHFNVVNEIIA